MIASWILVIAILSVGLVLERERSRSALLAATAEIAQEAVTPQKKRKFSWEAGAATWVMISIMAAQLFRSPTSAAAVIMPTIFGGAGVFLVFRYVARAKQERSRLMNERLVPLMMDRLVMAVESGLDLIPALRTVIDLPHAPSGKGDSISRQLRTLVESVERGLSFEEAAELARAEAASESLKQVMIHLIIAHREGGELIEPLREAAQASQLVYQDWVEEQIAQLPVKATVPLVLCFAGIMGLFLSVPLTRLLGFMAEATVR